MSGEDSVKIRSEFGDPTFILRLSYVKRRRINVGSPNSDRILIEHKAKMNGINWFNKRQTCLK